MPWVRIDDQFPHHPKVVGVGPLGIAMQVAGLCYCSQFLTDGFVPSSAVVTLMDFSELDEQAFNGRGNVCWIAVDKLVAAGIWEPVEGGYQIHEYLLYQPSREQVLKEREQARVRMNNRRSSEEVRANNRGSSDAPIPIPIPIPIPNPVLKETTPRGVVKKRRASPALRQLSAQELLDLFDESDKVVINQRFPGIDLAWVAGKCVEWHNARGGSGNWKLAFKNWLDNEKGNINGTSRQSPPTNPQRSGARFDNSLAKYIEAQKSDIRPRT